MTIPVVRKRAKRPKTRTGCRTCRQRHVKCDEEKPVCRRCRSSGKDCLGYDVIRTEPQACKTQAVLLPKNGSQVTSVNIPTLYPVHRSPALTTCEMSPLETYAFDFFRLQTVRQLPGSSWTLSWERLALQVGHHEPAVTHAAIALGSLHRALTFDTLRGSNGIDAEQHEFALQQYNIAMGHVRKHIENLEDSCPDSAVEIVLLVSLLFFCFEVMHSEDARATMHLRTGLRILYERIRRKTPSYIRDEENTKRVVMMSTAAKDNMDIILQTFIRLDSDLTIVGDDEPYLFPMCQEAIPRAFHSLEEAMIHLDAIAVKTHDFCRDVVALADEQLVSKRSDFDLLDDSMRNCLACAASRTIQLDGHSKLLARMQAIRKDLGCWTAALASIEMASQRRSAQLLTQIHFYYIWFVVSTWRDETEMAVDRFEKDFSHVLDIAEEYVSLHMDLTTSSPAHANMTEPTSDTRQAFTLGTDLVPCVAMIAFKCRTTSIRRRCISLIKAVNLQGVFDSCFLASFIQLIWNMEEQRARALTGRPIGVDLVCHEVPAKARFVEIELSPMHHSNDFYKADTGRLVYAVYNDNGELEAHQEMFHVHRPAAQGHSCKREDSVISPFWQADTILPTRFAPHVGD